MIFHKVPAKIIPKGEESGRAGCSVGLSRQREIDGQPSAIDLPSLKSN
jgi:hypothetical protein